MLINCLRCLFGIGLAGAAVVMPVGAWAQPNILWITTDDHTAGDVGFTGTAGLSTPRIDQLAAEGIVYNNAYTTSPVCSASRTAMMVGVYQTSLSLAMHHRPNNQSKLPLPAGIDPITTYFRNQGYFTANAKPDFNGFGKFDMNFSEGINNPLEFNDLFDGTDWRQAGSQPWFTQVNIFEPHRPFRGFNTDLARRDILDLPDDLPDHPLARADYADYYASIEDADDKIGFILDRLEADGLADDTIVFLFGDNGREFSRAKGSAYNAGSNVPLVVRVPEQYRVGRTDLAPGTVKDELVSMLDVTAASLSAAGIDLTQTQYDHLHGTDLLGASFTGRDEVIFADDRNANDTSRSRTVRVGDMLYVRNSTTDASYLYGSDAVWYSKQERPIHTLMMVMAGRGMLTEEDNPNLALTRPLEELYDLANDPYQLNNLAADPAYAANLADLGARLDQWALDTNDLGGAFDPDAQPALNWYQSTGRFRHLDEKSLPRDTTDYEYMLWWADLFNVDLNLTQGTPDVQLITLPNRSFENTALNDGSFDNTQVQGWTGFFSANVYNPTAGTITGEAADGQNVLVLNGQDNNGDGGYVEWAVDDNWGNLVSFDEAAWWVIELEMVFGRRTGSVGAQPADVRVSLSNDQAQAVLAELFDFDGVVAQGQWSDATTFRFVIDDVTAQAHAGEQLVIRLENLKGGLAFKQEAQALIDAMSLSITLFGDFDGDFAYTQDDIDTLIANYGDAGFDLDGDGDADEDDTRFLIERIIEPTPGDANLDGLVDEQDLALVLNNYGSAVALGRLSSGDIDLDGQVGIDDLELVLARYASGQGAASSVPEPATLSLLGGLLVFVRRPRRAALAG